MAVPVAVVALGVGALAFVVRRKASQGSVLASLGAGGFDCSRPDPPPPPHLKVLAGVAHPDLQQWASTIAHDGATAFGQMFEREFGGRTVTARVEHHTWTTHGAEVVPGCFKGVTLYEPRVPASSAAAGGVDLWEGGNSVAECRLRPWLFVPGYCQCILAGGDERSCIPPQTTSSVAPMAAPLHGHTTGLWPTMMWGEPPVSRDEAMDAASQLQSMYPNIRTLVAQAPDGFYVRVITGFGGGGLGRGGGRGMGRPTLGPKGMVLDRLGLNGGWDRDVLRTMDRIPSQLGRVRVVIDRLVSPDFAVGGAVSPRPAPTVPQVRAAQRQLRNDLLDRCKCVRGWIRGIGIGWEADEVPLVELLVDGGVMSDEAIGREIVTV